MANFNMQCPHCGAVLMAASEWAGMMIQCTNCGQQVQVIVPQQQFAPGQQQFGQPQFGQQQFGQQQFGQQQFGQQQFAPGQQQFYPGQQPGYYGGGKSRMTYLLLGIFLGQLGAHDFYAGYKNNGIIKLLITLLTCGCLSIVSWIWAIVDVCNNQCDANGVPFNK